MAPSVSNQDLGDAVLDSIRNGAFPQSEQVASAQVTTEALPKLLDIVRKAREDARDEIRTASRDAASDVDGWITQARKLQGDIKRSQEAAHDIVQQAEKGKEHTAKVQDAMVKVSLLYSEIGYNETLVHVVERIRDISALLDSAQDAAVHGTVMQALDKLEAGEATLKQLDAFENTRVVGVLTNRVNQLRAAIAEDMTDSWNALLVIDSSARRISFKASIERDAPVTIETVVEALTRLNLLDGYTATLSRNFDNIITCPRLAPGSDRTVSSFSIAGDDIWIDGPIKDLSVKAAIDDICSIADFVSTRLPPSINVPMSAKLVPVIVGRLISHWLLPNIPLSIDGVPQFRETHTLVSGLVDLFDELEWTGHDSLRHWLDDCPNIWLARQKEAAIVRLHRLCPRRVRQKETVERVETQMVSKGDAMLDQHDGQDEDWGEAWDDDEKEPSVDQKAHAQATSSEIEEEDMSAWDDEDEQRDVTEPKEGVQSKQETEEEDVDAWGWGDEADAEPTPSNTTEVQPETSKTTAPRQSTREKEVTLRESYTVTAIPDTIIEIILQVISDVEQLYEPDSSDAAVAPASAGLYAIPSLVLAMYRATAASHYGKDVAGNMLIYNDCSRLSDQLQSLLQEQAGKDHTSPLPQHLRPSTQLHLTDDIRAIERFGKRAYGREMDSQRTIIKDLLSGAQGFKSCTASPFDMECDNAIAMTIDRIEEVKRTWQSVLSPSALLQSLGSLVSTALTKLIDDVEEMTDIAEDESKKLHSYCVSLASLSSLFQTKNAAGEVQDMSGIYTPNWFRFQYLSEILDASLADIRYFWTDGELKLEMEAEEVVELILALFAESEYRRKAIAEIRRTSMV
ncbi:hypothetical protein M011DRAFT_419823 [Sporormia fimetaria CBS 119925]|uniref:ZW10 C-terminal helical domain-containing protein n=1 Tax=Sporormia fimetaria CBS 119925 TaxID=1340428 RepID=A0A6A6VK16_9PLEO|nr:hypothetical protein M011DRAFT_419823 [Sporormia fimetaria CBS 119925]